MATVKPRTCVGEVFKAQIERLRKHAEEEDLSIRNQEPSVWYAPANFTANIFNFVKMNEALSRAEHEQGFIDTVGSKDEIGTTGDLAMTQLQGDFLATLERAYKQRHMSSVRMRIQAAGRRMGHAAETGVIPFGMKRYVEHIDRLNKGEQRPGII